MKDTRLLIAWLKSMNNDCDDDEEEEMVVIMADELIAQLNLLFIFGCQHTKKGHSRVICLWLM